MIDKLIRKSLEELNILIEYMDTETYEDKYIIYAIYDSKEASKFDDESESELVYINFNFWYKNQEDHKYIKIIKNLMKKNGFYYNGGKSLKDKSYKGFNMDFIYELEEEEI